LLLFRAANTEAPQPSAAKFLFMSDIRGLLYLASL